MVKNISTESLTSDKNFAFCKSDTFHSKLLGPRAYQIFIFNLKQKTHARRSLCFSVNAMIQRVLPGCTHEEQEQKFEACNAAISMNE